MNSVVSMHYTLKDPKGTVLDSSLGGEPLAYIQGIGNIIPGLEKQMQGRIKGDKLDAVIAPEEGYGERRNDLVHVVSKQGFKGGGEPTVGMQVQLEGPEGRMIAIITQIEGDNVTLDLNHPLAGVTLHFAVEVMDVRVATAEELDHGHVHGPGGHHH